MLVQPVLLVLFLLGIMTLMGLLLLQLLLVLLNDAYILLPTAASCVGTAYAVDSNMMMPGPPNKEMAIDLCLCRS
jgi:hypothetical protein